MLYDVARRHSHRGQSHDGLALAAILVNVGYHKMIVRCRTTSRTTSHDIVRRRGSSYDICAIVVRQRRATSSMIVRRLKTSSKIVRHSTAVIRSSYDIAEVTRPSISASHHVKSYVIVRLSYDYRSPVVRCCTIYI